MGGLTDLTNFSTGTFAVDDLRNPGPKYNVPFFENQELTTQALSFNVAVSSEIIDIIRPEIANIRYTIDVRAVSGATVTWFEIPSGCNVTELEPGLYQIDGIDTVDIWNTVKDPLIDLPVTFFGSFFYYVYLTYVTFPDGEVTEGYAVGTYIPEALCAAEFSCSLTGGTISRIETFMDTAFTLESIVGAIEQFVIFKEVVATTDATAKRFAGLFSNQEAITTAQTVGNFTVSSGVRNLTLSSTATQVTGINYTADSFTQTTANASLVSTPGFLEQGVLDATANASVVPVTFDSRTRDNSASLSASATLSAVPREFEGPYDLTLSATFTLEGSIGFTKFLDPVTLSSEFTADTLGTKAFGFTIDATVTSSAVVDPTLIYNFASDMAVTSDASLETDTVMIYNSDLDTDSGNALFSLRFNNYDVNDPPVVKITRISDGAVVLNASPSDPTEPFGDAGLVTLYEIPPQQGDYEIRVTGDGFTDFTSGYLETTKVWPRYVTRINNWGYHKGQNSLSGFCAGMWNLEYVPAPPNVSISQMFANTTLIGSTATYNNRLSFVSDWDVSHLTSLAGLFQNATRFNADLSNWDVSNVTTMSNLFNNTTFNSDISTWDVSNVTTMRQMFYNASLFNQDISSWNTTNVIDYYYMFGNAENYNQPLSTWNVSNGENFSRMFDGATSFNQPLNTWSFATTATSPFTVYSMDNMFNGATSFNQPLSNWNTELFEEMQGMFLNATNFNQDLSGWCVPNIASEPTDFATGSALIEANKPVWGTCP